MTRASVSRKHKRRTKSSNGTNGHGRGAKEFIPRLELEDFEPQQHHNPGVEDTHTGSVKFAWLGSGQCGGRVTQTMYQLGYHKVLALNTTDHDLAHLNLPVGHKYLMDIGVQGAGKNMKRGQEAVKSHRQQILHHAEQIFGNQIDHMMVSFGAGGGTGSGSALGLLDLAKTFMRHTGVDDPRKHVGALMTLPTIGEAKSPLIARNAYQIASELVELACQGEISPLIIMDNAKISSMYPNLTVKAFWPTINKTVCTLFDIFNRLSALPSQYTAFDPADYQSVLTSGGCCIMGLTRVDDLRDKFAISESVKANLSKTLLADGFDLRTARMAGCVAVGGSKLMAQAKGLQDNLDFAFDTMAEITGEATIHRGIYEDSRDLLRVYTIIGGLEGCQSRLERLCV